LHQRGDLRPIQGGLLHGHAASGGQGAWRGGWLKGTYGSKKVMAEHRKIFYGRPGVVNVNTTKGYRQETLIGADSRAIMERHHTDHYHPEVHSNPHDHVILWDGNGDPQYSKPINHEKGKAPKLKGRK
jgi:hypothetical protein